MRAQEKVEQLNMSEKSLEEKVKHLNESLSRSGSPNRYSIYLLYWCKSTNTYAETATVRRPC